MTIEINFRFLRELQRKERENAELQKLPDDFLDQLKAYIKRKVDLLSRPEMLTFAEKKEIENLKPVIKYIFDKREQKIVAAALRAARTGIKPKNMLPHEEALFNALKTEIVKNRLLLDEILMLIDPAHRGAVHLEVEAEGSEAREAEMKEKEKVTIVGAAGGGDTAEKEKERIEEEVKERAVAEREDGEETRETKEGKASPQPAQSVEEGIMRIEIVKDVPAFIGIDLNKYGPWKKGQVVALPEKIARALIKTGRAKELQI